MGKAYVCALSGQTLAGEGKGVLEIRRGNLKVEVRVFEKENNAFIQSQLSPAAVEKIETAVKSFLPAEEKKAEGKS